MNEIMSQLDKITPPQDYFKGAGHYQLPTPTNILFFVRRMKSNLQQEALKNRSHHRFVLALNLETEGYIHADNLALRLDPGQAILIQPFQFHHFSHLASNRLLWLFCTFELEPRTFLEPLRNRAVTISPLTKTAYNEVLDSWFQPQGELRNELLQSSLLRLLLSLKQDRRLTANDLPPDPGDHLLRDINRLMAEWRGRTVTVADLAGALNLSSSHLRNVFKESAGVTLGRYIQNYRINRAMALLKTSPLSIAEVAEEAGFGSPQAFSRIFKKEAGSSPRSYRKK